MTFSSFHDPAHLYYVTATVCGWKHLFADTEYVKIVLESLGWMQAQKRILLFAFVLMPSHLHVIMKPEGGTIGGIVRQFGSYTAHSILEQLRMDQEILLLEFFHKARRDKRHEHSIWQDIQAINIYSSKFLSQKMEYIHNNPVAKDWQLVQDRADYKYSSACLYDLEKTPVIEVTNVYDWLS